MSRGKLVLIIGPSGVGKSVVLKALLRRQAEFRFPRSATTRQRRAGESDDLYRFVTEEEFDDLAARGAFLESAVVHGGARYGALMDEIIPHIERGEIVVREVDVQGFDSIRTHKLFRGPGAPYRLESVFLLPESREQLIERIRSRAPIAEEELKRRIASMEQEMTYAGLCSAEIVNREGAIEETIREVEKVVLSR